MKVKIKDMQAKSDKSKAFRISKDSIKKAYRFLKRNGRFIIGGSIVAVILFGAIFAPLLTPWNPEVGELVDASMKPNAEHIMGCDYYGRDIFARVLYGSRTTLIVAIGAQLITTVVGTILGLICGYYKWAEKILMRILEAFNQIPNLLLCLMMVAIFGAGTVNLMLAMAVGTIPSLARMIRNQVLSLREKEFIESEKAMGASDLRTLFVHMVPAFSSYLIVRFTTSLAGCVLRMTSLSFLGLGLSPIIPSWGGMISEGQTLLFSTPHMVFWPAFAICLTVFGFSMLGDAVRDKLDPKLR